VLVHRPTTLAECDELQARVEQCRDEAPCNEALCRSCDDQLEEIQAVRMALTDA
jgi:hypothetical protein